MKKLVGYVAAFVASTLRGTLDHAYLSLNGQVVTSGLALKYKGQVYLPANSVDKLLTASGLTAKQQGTTLSVVSKASTNKGAGSGSSSTGALRPIPNHPRHL